MRLVLDTNILARVASSPRGPAAELFDRIGAGHLLVTSPEMLAELERVLAYPRVRKLHHLGDEEIKQFVREIEAGSAVVRLPQKLPQVVKADPDDDVVVATAVIGAAHAICTRNHHFYAEDVVAYLARWAIDVVDDLQLLKVLRGESCE